MDVIRTPDACFAGLLDYPFEPHYLDVEPGLRMHYVDEGPREGRPILMLHGEPSWSFLYRKMIPLFARAGYRAIAPDLIGFGKSDKPTRMSDYSYARHVGWVTRLVHALDLREVTLVAQDWGSLIGLRVAPENEARFARICIANGFLPTAQQGTPAAFRIWRPLRATPPCFPSGESSPQAA